MGDSEIPRLSPTPDRALEHVAIFLPFRVTRPRSEAALLVLVDPRDPVLRQYWIGIILWGKRS
jgi:hypothetical protein